MGSFSLPPRSSCCRVATEAAPISRMSFSSKVLRRDGEGGNPVLAAASELLAGISPGATREEEEAQGSAAAAPGEEP
jgi:hypothetical protein